MAKQALNDTTIRAFPIPARGQKKYWDTNLPNFGVRISQGGSKTFVVNHDNTLITIGRYGIVSMGSFVTSGGETNLIVALFMNALPASPMG